MGTESDRVIDELVSLNVWLDTLTSMDRTNFLEMARILSRDTSERAEQVIAACPDPDYRRRLKVAVAGNLILNRVKGK